MNLPSDQSLSNEAAFEELQTCMIQPKEILFEGIRFEMESETYYKYLNQFVVVYSIKNTDCNKSKDALQNLMANQLESGIMSSMITEYIEKCKWLRQNHPQIDINDRYHEFLESLWIKRREKSVLYEKCKSDELCVFYPTDANGVYLVPASQIFNDEAGKVIVTYYPKMAPAEVLKRIITQKDYKNILNLEKQYSY